jgi:OOP family OmpA-OmpF porin
MTTTQPSNIARTLWLFLSIVVAVAISYAPTSSAQNKRATEDKVSVKADVYFALDDTTVSTEGKKVLDQLVALTRQFRLEVIIVEGNAALTSSAANALVISNQRAAAVKAYLVTNGIPSDRVSIKGLGAQKPLGDNTTAAGRFKNNRVDIEMIGAK